MTSSRTTTSTEAVGALLAQVGSVPRFRSQRSLAISVKLANDDRGRVLMRRHAGSEERGPDSARQDTCHRVNTAHQ